MPDDFLLLELMDDWGEEDEDESIDVDIKELSNTELSAPEDIDENEDESEKE